MLYFIIIMYIYKYLLNIFVDTTTFRSRLLLLLFIIIIIINIIFIVIIIIITIKIILRIKKKYIIIIIKEKKNNNIIILYNIRITWRSSPFGKRGYWACDSTGELRSETSSWGNCQCWRIQHTPPGPSESVVLVLYTGRWAMKQITKLH
jgi:hypothetical protein